MFVHVVALDHETILQSCLFEISRTRLLQFRTGGRSRLEHLLKIGESYGFFLVLEFYSVVVFRSCTAAMTGLDRWLAEAK